MAKIHGIVYIIVGLFVSILSWKFNKDKLIIFVYTGLLFILIGIAKLIFSFISRRKGKSDAANQKIQPKAQLKYCPQCGSAAKLHDKFCAKCGARL